MIPQLLGGDPYFLNRLTNKIMRKPFLPLGLLFFLSIFISCETENPEIIEPEPEPGPPVAEEIINIPDEYFKAELLSTNSIDINGDRVGDSDIDLNNDGEIQRSEADVIEGLVMNFPYYEIGRLVDFSGIENFKNLKSLKISGAWETEDYTTPEFEVISFDFTGLKKLEYLEFNNLFTNYSEVLDLSGLTSLKEVKLINDRPYYDVFTDENIILPENFMDVNFEDTPNLTSLDITNSFLNIDFCQIPSLERLNMYYLEGGEPEVFDFHCLTNLEWLDISENHIESLILKNGSALNTLVANDIGSGQDGFANYSYIGYICIDDLPEEREQITNLMNENTELTTSCTF